MYLIIKLFDLSAKSYLLETVGTAALIIVALTPIMITMYTSGLLNRINVPKTKHRGLAILVVILLSAAVALGISAIAYFVTR